MNNFKNLLILTLTALLGLSLFTVFLQIKHTHPAPIAPKTYDAVKLLNYEKCLDRWNTASPVSRNPNDAKKELGSLAQGKGSPSDAFSTLCASLLK
jgi:hypothetical protein